MGELEALEQHDPRVLALKAVLLTVWAVITFGFSYFARDLQFMMGPWRPRCMARSSRRSRTVSYTHLTLPTKA